MPLENSTMPIIDQEPVGSNSAEHLFEAVQNLADYEYGVEPDSRMRERREQKDAKFDFTEPEKATVFAEDVTDERVDTTHAVEKTHPEKLRETLAGLPDQAVINFGNDITSHIVHGLRLTHRYSDAV